MTWRDAFFEQARSDLEIYEDLNRPEIPLCHRLHFLQMATEKLSKGFLSPPNGDQPPRIHNMLVRFLRTLRDRSDYRNQLGYRNQAAAFRSMIDGLMTVADQIESLAPAVDDAARPANCEYPCQANGRIVTPVSHSFAEIDQLALRRFDRLIRELIRIAE